MLFGKKNQKHHIIDVIDYEGPSDVFVWKHECEDFNTKSQLIVHESQEAIFFKNGQALDTFQSGRYTLSTQNYPFIRNLVERATGGVSPFRCEVYYINKAVSMGMSWGTDSPIEMQDPEHGLFITLTAYGDFSLRVVDSRKLLVKLVGTVPSFAQEDIMQYFSSILASHVNDCIVTTMLNNNVGALRVNTQLLLLSGQIREMLGEVFAQYGLELNHFAVASIKAKGLEELGEVLKKSTLDNIAASGQANVDRIKMGVDVDRIQMEGAARNNVALGKGTVEAQINQMKGISEQQRLGFEVAKTLASNEGGNSTIVSGVGVPGVVPGTVPGNVTMNVMQSPAGMAGDVVRTVMGQSGVYTQQAGIPAPQPAAQPAGDDFAARLDKLKMMHDRGMISDEAYQAKVDEIMNSI